MQTHVEGEDDDEGKSGSGDFGRPQLKPNLETLFDPTALLAETQSGEHAEMGQGLADVENFGQWELRASSLMLYHRQLKKRLMLAQLDAPLKMMKVIVALSTQSHADSDWDVENLVKAMDYAAHKNFGRGLYVLIGLANDTARLDWKAGTVGTVEQPRGPFGAL